MRGKVNFMLVFVIIINTEIYSQNHWQYMSDNFHSGYINTAYVSNEKWQIALPHLSVNNGLSGVKLKNFITKSASGNILNQEDFINAIDDKAHLYANIELTLLGIGKRLSNGYLSAGYGLRGNGNASMQKELATLLSQGNQSFIGKEQNYKIALQYQMMHQIYIGYVHQIDKLNVGLKFKYLNGISSLNTNQSNISLHTLENNYHTTIKNNLNIHSSYPISIDTNFNIESPTINFSKNYGYGIDIGLEYLLDENSSLMLSVNDLGKITWKDKVYQYVNEGQSVVKGLNIQDLINGKAVSIEDTISSIFNLIPNTSGNYATNLIPMINIGGKHTVNSYTIAAMISQQFFSYGNRTYLSLMAVDELTKHVQLGLSYTYKDDSHFAGVSAGLKLGPVKLMLSAQNALFPFGIRHLQSNQLNAGMSIEFGKIKNKNEQY